MVLILVQKRLLIGEACSRKFSYIHLELRLESIEAFLLDCCVRYLLNDLGDLHRVFLKTNRELGVDHHLLVRRGLFVPEPLKLVDFTKLPDGFNEIVRAAPDLILEE